MMANDNDWKSKVGFTINYDSSEEDPDIKDVVMRYRHSDYLLEDGGDGAEADLLGTTPPRQRQRENLQKIRNKSGATRFVQGSNAPRVTSSVGKNKKYVNRVKSRNSRDDMMTDDRTESLPYGADGERGVPTLVESCSRFMSLTSRLKCREVPPRSPSPEPVVERRWQPGSDAPPATRVTFHKIFSTLINMGNIEKGCRRTISREEQVWQNELKDLIWLELQAKLAGRTLAQQDAFLCVQRKIVPTIVQNIRNYRFVNPNPCRARTRRLCVNGSREDLDADNDETTGEKQETEDDDGTLSTQTSIELLLSGEKPPEEVPSRPLLENRISEEEKQWAVAAARAVVEFARCWMQFVVERCDKGRGLRPRWASQGLEFLMLACDPCNTKHLTDAEFEELKKEMDSCISHVIGSRPATARAADNAPNSPVPPLRARARPKPLHAKGDARAPSPLRARSAVPSPPTPPCEPDPLLSFEGLEPTGHNTRILEAIKSLDEQRDIKLRELKTVGRVLESVVASYEPKLRQLKFKWQRGLKIGAGTFGKVYTVVNTESGQLLAMKEISIAAGDRRALQKAANELRVLEGVIHPHLVRYYGCELHREEMLLFMELCVEGSLEALVVNSGALAEPTVRRYSKQLLSAVGELHARNIAHRDIKSGNIFLTNEGHCLKLGDFGCAVKIRANTTAAGELQGCVGTQAYMAPEVFMKSSGHGRAADIWSLGCVVAEMASGKRPFSEYDSNYQIMFVVGMGGRPQIPESLSSEGQDFCLSCLTHEPDQRPRAEQLGLHHFLMLKADDDCDCQPAFLIT
ncbi:mitogen-activated protein kinase kinase kinase 4 [Hyposmocoma kahamanoa]|uniref:mitogen-activated protein kinase kinase kinase 4 n=1 Tax=Hyposmocoma kahamanoa TaxID=1477025 RepID=UPI000E6D5E95|nr:mitogen-activated protein kinase kinase kinase 4 [Hyposmocoma kahamanoa]